VGFLLPFFNLHCVLMFIEFDGTVQGPLIVVCFHVIVLV
jgi:hypothetical protein